MISITMNFDSLQTGKGTYPVACTFVNDVIIALAIIFSYIQLYITMGKGDLPIRKSIYILHYHRS